MILAEKLQGGIITFPRLENVDFVNKGLCALSEIGDGYHWKLEEKFVLTIIEKMLQDFDVDYQFTISLEILNNLLGTQGSTTTTKGNAIEPIVRHTLEYFNNIKVCDLPFLKDLKGKLPQWCETAVINIMNSGTAQQLNLNNDLTFLSNRRPGEMLVPLSTTRPDGIFWFDFSHGGSLAIKFFTSFIPEAIHKDNKATSDLRKCFQRRDKDQENATVTQNFNTFAALQLTNPIDGILRIHLVFPGVVGGTPASEVEGNDVLVYIDCANMDTFFCDSHHNSMSDIKRVISYVALNSKASETHPGCGCRFGDCKNGRCGTCVRAQKKCTQYCKCDPMKCNNR